MLVSVHWLLYSFGLIVCSIDPEIRGSGIVHNGKFRNKRRQMERDNINQNHTHTHTRALIDTHDDVLFSFVPSFDATVAIPSTSIASTPVVDTLGEGETTGP